MKKVILWLAGMELNELDENIDKLFHSMDGIEVAGVSSRPEQMDLCEALDVPVITAQDLYESDVDYILMCGANEKYIDSIDYLKKLGVQEERLLPEHVADICGFTPERYHAIRRIRPTIFSISCFAGYVYHRFAMPFYSPTINMFQSADSFLQFAGHLRECCEKPIRLSGTGYDDNLKAEYPIYHIGERVEIHMNHYHDTEIAEKKWRERVKRINWDHVVLVMYTEKPEVLEAFDDLPVTGIENVKKICFVSFPSEKKCAYYIPLERLTRKMELWDAVNNIGGGRIRLFDMFEMMGV